MRCVARVATSSCEQAASGCRCATAVSRAAGRVAFTVSSPGVNRKRSADIDLEAAGNQSYGQMGTAARRIPAGGGTRWTPGSRAQPVSPKAAARLSTAPALRRSAPGCPRARSAAPAPAKRDACTWGMGTRQPARRARAAWARPLGECPQAAGDTRSLYSYQNVNFSATCMRRGGAAFTTCPNRLLDLSPSTATGPKN
jgi:hypothetical protein